MDKNKEYKNLEEVYHKLEISERKFRKLFETAYDGILLVDPVTDKITDANPYILELIGYTIDEVQGKELWEIGAFKDTQLNKDVFEKIKKQGYIRYEDLPLESKNGGVVEVEIVSNLYRINSEKVIQFNIRDISDRKKREELERQHLRETENLNNLLVEQQKELINISNIKDMPDKDKAQRVIDQYQETLTKLRRSIDRAKNK